MKKCNLSSLFPGFDWVLEQVLIKKLSWEKSNLEPMNSTLTKKIVSKALRCAKETFCVSNVMIITWKSWTRKICSLSSWYGCSCSYWSQQPKHNKGWNSKEEPWGKSQGYRNLEPETWKMWWGLAVIQVFRIKNRHPSWWASSCQW